MSLTRKDRQRRSNDCHFYKLSVDKHCELIEWLVADRNAVAWMKRECVPESRECHHILGRGKSEAHEWHCNLIVLDSKTHHWVEAHPREGLIASLWAKWRKWLAYADISDLMSEQVRDWSPTTMDELARPFSGLAGKLSFLMNEIDQESIYAKYGAELLKELGR